MRLTRYVRYTSATLVLSIAATPVVVPSETAPEAYKKKKNQVLLSDPIVLRHILQQLF